MTIFGGNSLPVLAQSLLKPRAQPAMHCVVHRTTGVITGSVSPAAYPVMTDQEAAPSSLSTPAWDMQDFVKEHSNRTAPN